MIIIIVPVYIVIHVICIHAVYGDCIWTELYL